jgi:glycerol-1-phosphate dehydrogenase [NAD(P)+]
MKNMLHLVHSDGCSPGKAVELGIREILLGEGALGELPALLERLSEAAVWKRGHVAVLCDEHTRKAAGNAVVESLSAGGVRHTLCELHPEEEGDLVPNEQAIGAALVAVPEDVDLLVSVGSGTITDLTRYIAFRLNLPFVAIPTAPSVDGFTSSVAPLILGGIKTTLETAAPVAVLADSKVLSAAPPRLLSAGIGDLAGKLIARSDWLLSNIVNDEPRCDYIIDLVDGYVRGTLALDVKATATIQGAERLFEGLVVSGLGITLVGTSRPASGAEHHISHFLEMQHERGNAPRLYHGESVAVGTYLVSMLYHRLVSRPVEELAQSLEAALEEESRNGKSRAEERVALIRKLFGPSGDLLVDRYLNSRPDAARRRMVVEKLRHRWDEFSASILKNLPRPEQIAGAFVRTGVPYDPVKLGIRMDIVHSALLCAKEVRTRYSVLSLLDELGILETEAHSVIQLLGYRPE